MKTLKELVAETLAAIKGQKPVKGIVKFVIKASGKLKSDLNITDQAGVGYFIDNDAVIDPSDATGSPVFLANPDGTPTTTPAPDGDITTADGLVISVSGGMVSAVKQATAMTSQQTAAKIAALEKNNTEILAFQEFMKTSMAALLEALKAKQPEVITANQLEAKLNERMLALKKEISSNHVPQRTKAERKSAEKTGLRALGPLALKMRYPKGIPSDVQKLLDEE